MPATDSVAASANIPDLCGPRNYSINENYSFVTILPPAGSINQYTNAWQLSYKSDLLSEVG